LRGFDAFLGGVRRGRFSGFGAFLGGGVRRGLGLAGTAGCEQRGERYEGESVGVRTLAHDLIRIFYPGCGGKRPVAVGPL
jgi:hypothetical protein